MKFVLFTLWNIRKAPLKKLLTNRQTFPQARADDFQIANINAHEEV